MPWGIQAKIHGGRKEMEEEVSSSQMQQRGRAEELSLLVSELKMKS
jgi:hypothetical protein